MRADLLLVDRGLAATRSQAQRLIASGVLWREGDSTWKKIAKNGDELPAGSDLQLTDTAEAKYISRGGLKLEGALSVTGLKVTGLFCLDLGQSTGGFTDCLLQHGAARVVGIDVGHGQLHERLRTDARVVCIEAVNARSLSADDFWSHCARADKADSVIQAPGASDQARGEPFDLLVGDLSFISLTLVLPAMVRLLKLSGDALVLVKPQFELQPGQVGKGASSRSRLCFCGSSSDCAIVALTWVWRFWPGLSLPSRAVMATANFSFMPARWQSLWQQGLLSLWVLRSSASRAVKGATRPPMRTSGRLRTMVNLARPAASARAHDPKHREILP